MTDLHYALLGVGAAVIAGVLGYNAWVERRARRRAEKAFGQDHADVLFDASARKEPSIGRIPEPQAPSEETVGAAPIVLDGPPSDELAIGEGLDVPAGPEAEISNRIDTIGVILADDPITREALEPLLDALQRHTTPVHVEGIVDEQWQPVESARRRSWREVRAGLQLASRSGPLTEDELTTFNETIASFAASVTAVSQRESPAAAAGRANALDRFCADTDIEVAVNVVGLYGATFALARVKALALEHGLAETASGALVSHARDGTVEFSVRRLDAGAKADLSYTTGLTLALDLPHVADPSTAFQAMVGFAEAICATLGGELVDDNRKPLTEAGLAAIRRQMEQVLLQMEAYGIPAGGRLARRLYA